MNGYSNSPSLPVTTPRAVLQHGRGLYHTFFRSSETLAGGSDSFHGSERIPSASQKGLSPGRKQMIGAERKRFDPIEKHPAGHHEMFGLGPFVPNHHGEHCRLPRTFPRQRANREPEPIGRLAPFAASHVYDLRRVFPNDQSHAGQKIKKAGETVSYCHISCKTRPTEPFGCATSAMAASVGAISFTAIFS